ncbi:MAG TPA: metalloregulator ArsR/SmtB family transcription factor [Candidatus Bathyarchaeia archaeon]|nr:metalloregulator ArsR/SmtB family transcription factor [Candidatus Bathyarchaeia archaeon]
MSSYNCCIPDRKEFKRIVSLSTLLKLIAEESRLKLLCLLKKEEHCVCELMEYVEMSQSLISHHLSDLKQAGLVVDEKRGPRVYYQLTKSGYKVLNLLKEL